VPAHWFRPLNPGHHPLQDGETKIGKGFKGKESKRKWAITRWDPPPGGGKPDPDAILLPEEDELEPD
jgi:hypothetical protein